MVSKKVENVIFKIKKLFLKVETLVLEKKKGKREDLNRMLLLCRLLYSVIIRLIACGLYCSILKQFILIYFTSFSQVFKNQKANSELSFLFF